MRTFPVILALVSVLASCGKEGPEFRNVSVGDPLPSFSVRMNDGAVVTDASLKGDVSILIFFGPGCPDCKYQFDELQAFYEANPGICRVVAVSRGMADIVPSYMEENGYTFPWSAQKDRVVYEMFSDKGIPSMYVCNPEGIVEYTHFDDCMADASDLLNEVQSFLP